MKIVKVISMLTLFLIFVTSCQKDEQLSTVSNISASQGTYFGVVHITWSPVSGATYYNVERKGADGEWISAGSVAEPPFDDYGYGLSDNKLVEGAKYTYRISSASNDADDSQFSDPSGEGWIYELQPTELQAGRQDDGTIIVTWSDPNQNQINQTNLLGYRYIVKRRYENETSFTDLFTTANIGTVQNLSYTDASVAKDKKAYYKIQGWYEYGYKNMDYGTSDEYWIKDYIETQESGGSLQANYTVTELSSIPRASDGYGFVMLKNINNEIYAATIAKPALGNPVIYKLSGTSWQNISSSYPDGLQKNYLRISICGDGTNLWVGGVSDSAYVYAYNSGWSGNLAKGNLSLTNQPDDLLIEYAQNTLYALCDHDDKLEVYSYAQNNVWNSEAIIENSSVGVTNLEFKVFNDQLYVYYLIINTESNSTLKIKHYEVTSWQTDFEADYDYFNSVKVYVDNSDVIYFTSQSMEPAIWQGNVFKVTSSSTAEEMVSSSNTWLTFPKDIDYDDMGNPIVLYYKIISQTNAEWHLAVYENGEWKNVAGDFSNRLGPADIESNNGLYFVFGDGTDLVNSYPATLKAIKLNH